MSISEFMQSMEHRFACKRYKDTPLDSTTIHHILEAGRLSPTSYGLEGWHFHVIQSPEVKKRMFSACFDQESVATAPILIVITALKASSYNPYGSFVSDRGKRFPGSLEEFVDDYLGYYEFLMEQGRLDCWSRSQCYIACANMMQVAMEMGIQSCAIEGFDEKKVASIIELDTTLWQVALVITFGFPDEPERNKIRQPLDDLVTYH